jgi:hypothetical protein
MAERKIEPTEEPMEELPSAKIARNLPVDEKKIFSEKNVSGNAKNVAPSAKNVPSDPNVTVSASILNVLVSQLNQLQLQVSELVAAQRSPPGVDFNRNPDPRESLFLNRRETVWKSTDERERKPDEILQKLLRTPASPRKSLTREEMVNLPKFSIPIPEPYHGEPENENKKSFEAWLQDFISYGEMYGWTNEQYLRFLKEKHRDVEIHQILGQ